MANPGEFREEALQLISVTPGGALELNQDALAIIRNVPKPVAIVGVAGQYRTGKSYLLNRVILNRGTGFGVGPTVNPCTKGIWIWAKPLKGQTQDGKIVNIIVMDSEGLSAIDVDASHDSRIFSLVMLLSSMFIYNSLGSIDENALENLSLVANLTKSIHIRSSNAEEVDFEDFAFYMPSFLWVVRDFALELSDTRGEEISSKEYLEASLAEAKGLSDQVEQKNKIRRLLTSFFTERDCFTMVRPVINEEKLRELDKLPLDSLRPQFAEQVLELRKKIVLRARPKIVNGAELSGDNVVELAKTYIAAINDKGVPNIESAWTYLCKAQSRKAFDKAIEEYENGMRESLGSTWPVSKDVLKAIHRECAEQALKEFKRDALGDNLDATRERLEETIQEKYSYLKNENRKDFEKLLTQSMNAAWAAVVEPKLRAKEYKTLIDLEKDLKKLESQFFEAEPQGPNKQALLAEFMHKKITEGVYSFVSAKETENEEAQRTWRSRKLELEEELRVSKELQERDSRMSSVRVTELEKEKKLLEENIQALKESNEKFRKDRELTEEQLSKEKKESESTYQIKLQETQAELEQANELRREAEKELVMLKSGFDKEKSLLEAKAQQLSLQLNERSKSESETSTSLETLREEMKAKIKELTDASQAELAARTRENKTLAERVADLEDSLSRNEKEYKKREESWQATHLENETKFTELEKHFHEAEAKLKAIEERRESLNPDEDEDEIIRTLREKLSKLEEEARVKDDKWKQFRQQAEKEKAISKQAQEFLEAKCADLKRVVEETKKLYNDTLKAMETTASEVKVDYAQQMSEVAESHRKEMKALTSQWEAEKQALSEEITRLTDLSDSVSRQKTELEEKTSRELARLREASEALEKERATLRRELLLAEESRENIEKDAEDRWAKRVRNTEEEIQRLKLRLDSDGADANRKAEEGIKEITAFFEAEKERLERKTIEDKAAFENKLARLLREAEEKRHEEEANHEEEIETLQNEFKETVIGMQANIQTLQQELSVRSQQLDFAENTVKNLTENLETIRASAESSSAAARKLVEEEKAALREALEQVRLDAATKERELWGLKDRFEAARSDNAKAAERAATKITQLEEAAEKLRAAAEEQRRKADKFRDDLTEQQIEFGKKLALAVQQNDFMTHRCEEQTKTIEEAARKSEERLRIQKEELLAESSSLIARHEALQKEADTRYEAKRRQAKELETTLNEKTAELDRLKLNFETKVASLRAELERREGTSAAEIKDKVAKLEALRNSLEAEKKENAFTIENLKSQKYTLEMKLAELEANYEKDTALWNGKFEFQEEQKEQLKKELASTQNNFDLMLQRVRKMRSEDKEETVSSQSAMIVNLEQRHQTQMAEMSDKHKASLTAATERANRLEKEVRSLNDRLLAENNARLEAVGQFERKAAELAELERSFHEQLSRVKADREAKLQLAQRKADGENEFQRAKIFELETRLKEIEGRKGASLFEYEKDKARWKVERDQLISEKLALLENLDNQTQKVEALTRENEKVKADYKKSRKMVGASLSGMNIGSKLGFPLGAKTGDFELKMPSFRTNTKDNSGIDSINETINERFLEQDK